MALSVLFMLEFNVTVLYHSDMVGVGLVFFFIKKKLVSVFNSMFYTVDLP